MEKVSEPTLFNQARVNVLSQTKINYRYVMNRVGIAGKHDRIKIVTINKKIGDEVKV